MRIRKSGSLVSITFRTFQASGEIPKFLERQGYRYVTSPTGSPTPPNGCKRQHQAYTHVRDELDGEGFAGIGWVERMLVFGQLVSSQKNNG